MDDAQIYARLAEVFEDVFDQPLAITPEIASREINGWDSLGFLRFLLTIERTFKLKFATSEIGSIERLGDLVALIRKRLPGDIHP